MMNTDRVAFDFNPDGFMVTALQARAVVGWNDGVGPKQGAELYAAMQKGALHSKGATKLLQALHEAFGKGIPLDEALLWWLAAVNEHDAHREKPRNVVLAEVIKGTIVLLDFVPRPYVDEE